MKTYSLISENNGNVFHIDECTGLIQCSSADNGIIDGCPVTFYNLNSGHNEKYIPLNETFLLTKIINSKTVEVGYIECKRLLLETNEGQIYLASLIKIDTIKIFLLDCFVNSIKISFRELEQSYASSWLSACCTYYFTYEHEGHFSSAITLDVTSLRSKEDFYCYLGEIFFGYAGYAGRDLDGCYEMLTSRRVKGKITLTIKDEDKVKSFLTDATGHSDYYQNFKKLIYDIGGEVIGSY